MLDSASQRCCPGEHDTVPGFGNQLRMLNNRSARPAVPACPPWSCRFRTRALRYCRTHARAARWRRSGRSVGNRTPSARRSLRGMSGARRTPRRQANRMRRPLRCRGRRIAPPRRHPTRTPADRRRTTNRRSRCLFPCSSRAAPTPAAQADGSGLLATHGTVADADPDPLAFVPVTE